MSERVGLLILALLLSSGPVLYSDGASDRPSLTLEPGVSAAEIGSQRLIASERSVRRWPTEFYPTVSDSTALPNFLFHPLPTGPSLGVERGMSNRSRVIYGFRHSVDLGS
jgi:hypothetical protein